MQYMNTQRSFIADLIDNISSSNLYNKMYDFAQLVVAIGTCLIVLIYGLSLLFEVPFIAKLLWWVSGCHLLTIGYIVCLIRLLDIGIDISDEDYNTDRKSYKSTVEYKFTIVWGVVLLFLGISAMYFSGKYRDYYTFRTQIFLVDHENKLYHIVDHKYCEDAQNATHLVEQKGKDIDPTYTLCVGCEEWLDEIEFMADDAYIHP